MRNRTIRKLTPEARKLAHLVNELTSIERKLKNLIPEVDRLGHDSKALRYAKNLTVVVPDVASAVPLTEFERCNPGIKFIIAMAIHWENK